MESSLLTNYFSDGLSLVRKTFIFIILDIFLFRYGRLKHMYSIMGRLFCLKMSHRD